MAVAIDPPLGGIVAELGGKSRPLILRNAEIERFEKQHDTGVFAMFDVLFRDQKNAKAHLCRDMVALGLIGAGMPDRAADQTVAAMPPSENFRLRQIAADLVAVAFVPERPEKKSDTAGSSANSPETAISGTSGHASGKSSSPA
ncbi:GTA-gp10 family protein [Salipiger sp. 1_MG-2023]|uniref:GTA-gp10 family protein n=1 Tax=Salipiger sp. 1_MG-2023 TaxID=3062665 RepID=UPI0026E28922|nr:GTA-gp10 family protein [Salipiger sp. 1_MG-2023]MDO6587328.1 GTA-gp10 family protein [Salipiger sp. 1_MG-2023]